MDPRLDDEGRSCRRPCVGQRIGHVCDRARGDVAISQPGAGHRRITVNQRVTVNQRISIDRRVTIDSDQSRRLVNDELSEHVASNPLFGNGGIPPPFPSLPSPSD